jgi:uncharacterized membrane protein
MAKVIDIELRRTRQEHDRKDARAKAMQESFRKVRQQQLTLPENKQQNTSKLLALFKTKSPQKPSTPTGRK